MHDARCISGPRPSAANRDDATIRRYDDAIEVDSGEERAGEAPNPHTRLRRYERGEVVQPLEQVERVENTTRPPYRMYVAIEC